MQQAEARLVALNRRLDSISSAIRRHRDHVDAMTPGGRELLERSELLLRHTREAITYRWTRTEPLKDPSRETARRNICDDFADVLVELATRLLPALDGALSQRVPVELEPVLQRLADAAAPSINPTVILYAADAFNYSIERHPDPVTYLTTALAPGLAPPAPRSGPFLFLRVPAIERDCASLHCIILGHEIGHLRDWATNISTQISCPPPPPWCDKKGALLLQNVSAFKRYAHLIGQWGAELVADIVAAFTFGPASLLAFSELIGNLGSWRIDSSTHPAPDRRVLIILKVLKNLGFHKVEELQPILKHFDTEAAAAESRAMAVVDIAPDPADVMAWQTLSAQESKIIRTCKANIPEEEIFDATQWTAVREASNLLNSGLPCGEVLRAGPAIEYVEDVVIANALWLARIRGNQPLSSLVGLSPAKPDEASLLGALMDDLALKSFEIADWRRRVAWQ